MDTVDISDLTFFKWKLLYRLDASAEELFTPNNVLFHRSPDGKKFSLLGSLTNSYKWNGRFEFFIAFIHPNQSQSFLYWRQKINPITTSVGDKDVEFEPIFVPQYSTPFRGLCRSTATENTFLDGSPQLEQTNDWWYSIGSYSHFPFGTNCVPGPPDLTPGGVSIVSLYVRVPFNLTCHRSFHIQIFFISSSFYLLFFSSD